MKKRLRLVLIVMLAMTASAFGTTRAETGYSPKDGEAFGALLASLVRACETPTKENRAQIEQNLAAIQEPDDKMLAEAIAGHWKQVYLDPEYQLYLYPDGEVTELPDLPKGSTHAFAVLGYALENGEMRPELKGRCEAAAMVARAYPKAILVCSGGATGSNNPEQHTEAGMMKAYLAEECGIDPDRIFTDDRAMTTAENAINTLAILRKQGIETVTIVTSAYHQKWGQVLYNAMAAVYEIRYGYPVSILGNFCYNIGAEDEAYQHDDRIAIRQLSQILNLPKGAVQMDPRGK